MNGNEQAVFFALSDGTRLQLVEWLASERTGPATELAARLPLTRQAVSRHLSELEKAGLVRGVKAGRERIYSLYPEPLSDAQAWLAARAAQWDRSLARLRTYLEHAGEIRVTSAAAGSSDEPPG